MSRLGCLLNIARRHGVIGLQQQTSQRIGFQGCRRLMSSEPPEHHPDSNEPWIPEYIEKFHEPLEEKRSRLLYQSRKRGMLENGLLLGKRKVENLCFHTCLIILFRELCKEVSTRDG